MLITIDGEIYPSVALLTLNAAADFAGLIGQEIAVARLIHFLVKSGRFKEPEAERFAQSIFTVCGGCGQPPEECFKSSACVPPPPETMVWSGPAEAPPPPPLPPLSTRTHDDGDRS